MGAARGGGCQLLRVWGSPRALRRQLLYRYLSRCNANAPDCPYLRESRGHSKHGVAPRTARPQCGRRAAPLTRRLVL